MAFRTRQHRYAAKMTDKNKFKTRENLSEKIEESRSFAPKFDEVGLIPAVVNDATNGDLLMVAYMNAEALRKTIETGQAWYWSRSRKEFWRKGATSGNIQQVVEIRTDCDQDVIQLIVQQTGPACHTNRRSCFYRIIEKNGEYRLAFDES